MLPTPDTSHVSFENVYEPAEDSYLFLDTLSSASESAFLRGRFRPRRSGSTTENELKGSNRRYDHVPFAAEVGTGSGVVLAFLTAHAEAILGRSDMMTLGTDVNEYACRAAQRTVSKAIADDGGEKTSRRTRACLLDMVMADLASPLRQMTLDILIFNPPYVPTENIATLLPRSPSSMIASDSEEEGPCELESRLLALSYAGGTDGMETTNRLLAQIPDLLDPHRGVAYVLLCAQNKPEEVKQRIRDWDPGWHAETVGSSGKQGGWEKLQIIRIWRKHHQ